jgi:serine/threonine protein kinase
MSSDRWNKIEGLYHTALQLTESDRVAFLERQCDGDESLTLEVLSLLECAATMDSFMEEPLAELALNVLHSDRPALVGKSLARYQILDALGHGGMGEVYLAHDPSLNRKVALKVLAASITDNRVRVLRFQQEARAASAISHPNVAHIYEIGEANGWHYITMEYVKGATLRELLIAKFLDHVQAFDIAIQVCNALAAAHRAGVIHRDIKPENIAVTDDGYVKVLDFGLAKLIEASRDDMEANRELLSFQTQPEMLMGTSHYMSPEQVRRQPVDRRTDLWSLGIVLYEMLQHQLPFSGRTSSEVLVAILEHEPEISGLNEESLPADVELVLRKSLNKDPGGRYQSAEEMLDDMRKIVRHSSVDTGSAATGNSDVRNSVSEKTPSRKKARRAASTQENARPKTIPERIDTTRGKEQLRKRPGLRTALLIVPLVLMFMAVLYYGYATMSTKTLMNKPINLRFERFNLSGDIGDIVISPDGKYVAYIVTDSGKNSVHLTELATASDLQVTPASDKIYTGLSFSPDGTFVYYLESHAETGTLYRVSKLGGGQRTILENVNTAVSFSPDGSRIAFVRSNNSVDPADLVIAQADGSAPAVLAKRTLADQTFFFSDMRGPGPVWSPDGKTIACPTHGLGTKLTEVSVEAIEVETRAVRKLNAVPWFDISRMTWLADGSGIVVAASEAANGPWQLQLLAYSGNELRKLTNDPNNYTLVSGSRDSSIFLTRNIEETSSIWRMPVRDPDNAINLGQKKGLAEVEPGNNGTLIYTIVDGKNANLWLQDATGDRQITFTGDNYKARFSAAGQYVVYVSSSGGKMNIWRMNADGTQPVQLTRGNYEDSPVITRDGKWVIYRTGNDVRKVSTDGGVPIKLFDKSALSPELSPNGKLLAYFTNDNPESPVWHIEVYDLESNSISLRFDLPDSTSPFNSRTLTPDNRLHWTPDGKGLAYVSSSDGASNVWIQPVDGSRFRKLTNFKDAEIISFAWLEDGREILAVRNMRTYVPVLVRLF